MPIYGEKLSVHGPTLQVRVGPKQVAQLASAQKKADPDILGAALLEHIEHIPLRSSQVAATPPRTERHLLGCKKNRHPSPRRC